MIFVSVKPYWSNSYSMCMCEKSLQSCPTLCETVVLQAPLSMGFSSKDTVVGCHALLQGIFLMQWSNQGHLSLLHWQAGSLPLVPPGKPCYPIDKNYHRLIKSIWSMPSMLRIVYWWGFVRYPCAVSWWYSKELLDILFLANKAVEI